MGKIENISQGDIVYIPYCGKIEKCVMLSYVKSFNMYAVYLYLISKHTNMCYITSNGDDIFVNREEVFNYSIKHKKNKDPQLTSFNII